MVAVIALLLSIGIISGPSEATPEVADQYETRIYNYETDAI